MGNRYDRVNMIYNWIYDMCGGIYVLRVMEGYVMYRKEVYVIFMIKVYGRYMMGICGCYVKVYVIYYDIIFNICDGNV